MYQFFRKNYAYVNNNQAGFLLIEVIIAGALLVCLSIIISRSISSCLLQYDQASKKILATSMANSYLEQYITQAKITPKHDPRFTFWVRKEQIDDADLPSLHTILLQLNYKTMDNQEHTLQVKTMAVLKPEELS
jgi:type II secretory pathway pseudopilin PulG